MLNKKTIYGLHALLHLARNPHQHIGASKIAEATSAPYKFLESILQLLVNEGMLLSKAGRDGGYQLAESPDQITLADIARLLEGPIALLPCASHRFYEPCDSCPDPATCGIQDALVLLRNQAVSDMKQLSLTAFLQREADLRSGQRDMLRPTPYAGQ
ncbi:MAG: Rrf2 family transcriptional regulator [Bacteroidetes bacterium]|nr:Rrf2 family transcriptional regulator [Bacteroidota bacterium]